MKKTVSLILSILLVQGNLFSQIKTEKYTCKKTEGRFNGTYTSWYSNGKKKAEGKFDNNNRVGGWSVWDSLGNLIVQRNYENNFVYQTIIPKSKDEKARYVPKYNAQGFFDRFEIQEKMLVYSLLSWRLILPEDNPILFENNNLLMMMDKYISEGTLFVYADEYVTMPVKMENISKYKMIAIKLKEQYIYDNERNMAEIVPICLSPVLIDVQTKDTLKDYWFYFPEINPFLATIDISAHQLPFEIKTMSDLFFFRYFYGMIVEKEDIMYDAEKAFDKAWTNPSLKKESDDLEFFFLEIEHDMWMNLEKDE